MTRKDCAIAALVCFLVYSVIALLVTSPRMLPTGDEPHYLMAAHSLAVDGDILLRNNYVEQQYRIFYPSILAKRTTISDDNSRELPAFSPGLSFFLLPFYWIALNLFPAALVPFLRVVLCAVTAAVLYNLFRLTENYRPPSHKLWWLIPAFAFASPLLTYSSMFYPEIVASLLLVLSLRLLSDPGKHPMGLALGLAIVSPAILWLHPKYLILSVILFALGIHKLYAIRSKAPARMIHFVIAAAGIAGFFLFLHSEYGSWSPNRIYGGVQKDANLLDLVSREGVARLGVMFRMMFAFWIDQRFGILVYAPVYAAFFGAAIRSMKLYGAKMIPVFVLFFAHYLLLCWGAQMGGYAPPSRHFVVMIPMILLPVFLVFHEWSRFQRLLFGFLSALGLAVSVLILTHYRMIFTNATWRNPDGFSEFWSWLHMEHQIPQLTSASPDISIAIVWIVLTAFLGFLLYPKRPAIQ